MNKKFDIKINIKYIMDSINCKSCVVSDDEITTLQEVPIPAPLSTTSQNYNQEGIIKKFTGGDTFYVGRNLIYSKF